MLVKGYVSCDTEPVLLKPKTCFFIFNLFTVEAVQQY